MEPLRCLIYLIILGIVSYPAGRLISRRDPDPESFIFRERSWEKSGTVYDRLNIRRWKNRIPDISRVLKGKMPAKELRPGFTEDQIRIMIRETCTAEAIHGLLNLFGIRLLQLWKGTGGIVLFLIYVFLGNVPFILVQRYNRPRLKRLLQKLQQGDKEPAELSDI